MAFIKCLGKNQCFKGRDLTYSSNLKHRHTQWPKIPLGFMESGLAENSVSFLLPTFSPTSTKKFVGFEYVGWLLLHWGWQKSFKIRQQKSVDQGRNMGLASYLHTLSYDSVLNALCFGFYPTRDTTKNITRVKVADKSKMISLSFELQHN